MFFTLLVFMHNDWQKVRTFLSEEEAESFVNAYTRVYPRPRGGTLARAIKAGDWRITLGKNYGYIILGGNYG